MEREDVVKIVGEILSRPRSDDFACLRAENQRLRETLAKIAERAPAIYEDKLERDKLFLHAKWFKNTALAALAQEQPR